MPPAPKVPRIVVGVKVRGVGGGQIRERVSYEFAPAGSPTKQKWGNWAKIQLREVETLYMVPSEPEMCGTLRIGGYFGGKNAEPSFVESTTVAARCHMSTERGYAGTL